MGLHTAKGAALGTVAYMAPEQWNDARHAGTPTDIYAFGIMLSEILAGRHALLDLTRPHSQDDWRAAHLNPQPRPLREVAPDVPLVIEALYQRCLARDPDDRPTAAETLAVLQAGARAAGEPMYVPGELAPHTPFNEWVHWHMWSIAYKSFNLNDEALTCSDRALVFARQIRDTYPDSLPDTLLTRGNILKQMAVQALEAGNDTDAARLDQQVEAAYQESLMSRPPITTAEGRRGRTLVWKQIGVFNSERQRFAYADDAYDRALKLQPDLADTYFNRALNQRNWGLADGRAGRYDTAIAHLRQARIYAATALGMHLPPADRLLQDIEEILQRLGASE